MRSMHMRGIIYAISLLGIITAANAQVTGGQFSFEYLRMANSPHVSALGGICVANPDEDIALVMENPSLMRPGLHNELGLSYNNFYSNIKILNLQYGYHAPAINTSFFLGVQYLNYGSFLQTNDIGYVTGDFHGVDYAVSLGAARQYGQHWRYGAALKMAHSVLYTYKATAVLMDVGVNYYDTASLIDFGITAKNMGATVAKYVPGAVAEPLPFDLQIGISKRFKHLPLRLFATAHHLYEWDVRYSNPDDNVSNNILGGTDSSKKESSHFGDKLFRHLIFGAELSLGKRLLATVSYNTLRRQELAITTKPGSAGFAFGLGLNLNKFQVHYARTFYHIAGPYNELGITMMLNKMFGLGPAGEKMHWNADYPDWDVPGH